ncbi:uncharacterized protein LOC120010813 [Tripterygium wilfordii]|uniref:uncharacterized protein LOC120010813 n=1 Tax=Tripterygium wilfordii TaxID=458696 RepID=UPI0018F847DA|nr:uncharacterized protein LOC120010813 [Tripterygium wilfordii]
MVTGTKKRDCQFRVKMMNLKTDDDWMVRVVCGMHNHSVTLYMEGHSYVGKLSGVENDILINMSNNLVKPRSILYTLKNKDPNNVFTIKTIYNARQKFRTAEKANSLELLRAFPHVLLMDATYKTNRFRMSLFEIIGATSTNMTFCHMGHLIASLQNWMTMPDMSHLIVSREYVIIGDETSKLESVDSPPPRR